MDNFVKELPGKCKADNEASKHYTYQNKDMQW